MPLYVCVCLHACWCMWMWWTAISISSPHHKSHSAVLFCLQICVQKGPCVSEPFPDRKPCSVFFTAWVLSARLQSYHFPGTIGGFISLQRDWIDFSLLHRHPESLCVCLEPPEWPRFAFCQAVICK